MPSVIIVEDEAIVAMEYKTSLNNNGFHVLSVVACAEKALAAFKENIPDILLVDVKLKGDKDGIELVSEIRKESNCSVLFLTGNTDPRTLSKISLITNSSYLSKPILTKDLIEALLNLLGRN